MHDLGRFKAIFRILALMSRDLLIAWNLSMTSNGGAYYGNDFAIAIDFDAESAVDLGEMKLS